MQADGPIFIGGLDASGKTPLRALLDRLADVTFIRRAYLWTELYGRYGSLADDRNWQACLAAIAAHPGLHLSTAELAGVVSRLDEGQRGYLQLYGAVMEQIAARSGTARWGVQEGLSEVRADDLLAAYDGARIIHVIRDPRDRHAAALHGRRSTPWRVGVSVARWGTSAQLALANRGRLHDAYLVIRYEDLVKAPEPTLRQVCDFIGESVPPGMLSAARQWGFEAQPSIGIGALQLRAGELRFIERRLADPMRAFGYTPAASRSSGGAIADIATAAIATLAAWRWGDRDLRPEKRGPSARKLPA